MPILKCLKAVTLQSPILFFQCLQRMQIQSQVTQHGDPVCRAQRLDIRTGSQQDDSETAS